MRAVRPTTETSARIAAHEAGADGRAVDRRDDRLGAVDDVEHQVARLAQDAGAGWRSHQSCWPEARTTRPPRTPSPRPGSTTTLVSVSRSTVSQTSASWRCTAGLTALSPGAVHGDPQDALGRSIERQSREYVVGIGHGSIPPSSRPSAVRIIRVLPHPEWEKTPQAGRPSLLTDRGHAKSIRDFGPAGPFKRFGPTSAAGRVDSIIGSTRLWGWRVAASRGRRARSPAGSGRGILRPGGPQLVRG